MASPINKKTLRHLADLSRFELEGREEERLLKDLQKIVAYFEELKSLDTSGVEPMTGGTELKNVFRGDEERRDTNIGVGAGDFPEEERGFLKIPPVFNND